MNHHEVPDGTYTATVATCTDRFVTFIVPTCDPAVLVSPTDELPQADIVSGESMTITVADGTITGLETITE
jgi:hypothetical protein